MNNPSSSSASVLSVTQTTAARNTALCYSACVGAHQAGYDAYKAGLNMDINPFTEDRAPLSYRNWNNGWMLGFARDPQNA